MENQQDIAQNEEREQLVQAAEKLVLEIGLSEMTPEALRQEAGLSKDAFHEVFDSLEEASTPAIQQLLLRFEEKANSAGTLEQQLEEFLAKAMKLSADNGLEFIRSWIRDSLNMEQTYGMSIVFTFWDILGRFFERAIEAGTLIDDTPVDTLVNTVSAEFFGTLFCWCIMKGRDIDTVRVICNYCQRDLPVLLAEYRAPAI